MRANYQTLFPANLRYGSYKYTYPRLVEGLVLSPTWEFATFSQPNVRKEEIDRMGSVGWKAHISLHPRDLARGWDLIFPILKEKALLFKIVNLIETQEIIEGSNYNSRQKEAAHRLHEGLQITIYIKPGHEKQAQEMFAEIDHLLEEAGLQQGLVHRSERSIGRFVSVRHAGLKKYQDALSAGHYNPDCVFDPFSEILSNKVLLDYQNTIRLVLDRLGAVQFLNPDEEVKTKLHATLTTRVNDFFNKTHCDQWKGLQAFQDACRVDLCTADKKMKYPDWDPFFKNFRMLFTIVLTIPAIISFIQRAVTGRYTFFDTKSTIPEAENFSEAVMTLNNNSEQYLISGSMGLE